LYRHEPRKKFNIDDPNLDDEISSIIQSAANNTNIHFQKQNSVITQNFVGMYLNIIINILLFKNII